MNDILNPYIAGAPVVETSMFFGREDIFSWIDRSLMGKYVDHILVLHGQRRVGKTSVLKQIPNFLPKQYIQVFFDLQGRTNTTLDRFIWWIASEIVRTLKKECNLDLPKPDRNAFVDPEAFITDFLPFVRNQLGDKVLLLTFDEFDTLDRPDIQDTFAKSLIAYLKRLIEQQGLNFIFSIGSSGNKLENMQASYTDFFKTALYRKVSFLTPDDCRRLVTKPVEGLISYEPKAVQNIALYTSGHPYFTQLMCHELFSRCQKTGSRNITAQDVEEILPDVIERGTVNLKFVWDEASNLEKWTLATLAQGEGISLKDISKTLKTQQLRFSEAELNSAILHLRDKDVLTDENHFVIHLLKLWLLTNRPMDRVREELVQVNPIADRYLEIGDEYRDRGQISQALQSYQQALAAQENNTRALTSMAAIHAAQDDHQKAADTYKQALRLDDENIAARQGFSQAQLALAAAALQSGAEDQAAAAYQTLLKELPQHAEARKLLADLFKRQGDALLAANSYEPALDKFQQALDLLPGDEILKQRLESVVAQRKALQVKAFLEKADKALARQRWDEAAASIEDAIRMDPEDQSLHQRLLDIKDAPRQEKIKAYKHEAEAQIGKGNYPKAISAIQTAMLLAPEDKTLQDWLQSIQTDQSNAQLRLYQSQATQAETAADWDGAIAAREAALKLNPQDERLQSALQATQAAKRQAQLTSLRKQADASKKNGRLDEAVSQLEAYLALAPADAPALAELDQLKVECRQAKVRALKAQAEMAARQEKWEDAISAWQAYKAEVPAEAEQVNRQVEKARQKAALLKDYESAQGLIRKRQYGKAIHLLQGIIAQDPTYKSSSRLLVEAVEANKQHKPVWKQPWLVAGVSVGLLVLLVVAFLPRIQGWLGAAPEPGVTGTAIPGVSLPGEGTPGVTAETMVDIVQEQPQWHELVKSYIDNTAPTFEDDFSTNNPTWGYLDGVEDYPLSNFIKDESLLITSIDQDYVTCFPSRDNDFLDAYNFAMSFDLQIIESDNTVGFYFRSSNKQNNAIDDEYYRLAFTGYNWSIIRYNPTSKTVSTFFDGVISRETKTVQLIAYEEMVGVYLNDRLVTQLYNITTEGIENYFFVENWGPTNSVKFDNIQFWNLDGVDIAAQAEVIAQTIPSASPTAQPTEISTFAAPILAYINDTAPTFADDFSVKNPIWGWFANHGYLTDHITDEKLIISDIITSMLDRFPARENSFLDASNFALSYEFQINDGQPDLGIYFRSSNKFTVTEDDDDYYQLVFQRAPGQWSVFRHDPTYNRETRLAYGAASVSSKVKVLLIAFEDTVEIYLNDQLVAQLNDITTKDNQNYFFVKNYNETDSFEFDNIQFWNLDGVDIATQAEVIAPTAQPTEISTFAAPILAYINDTAPTFADDFSYKKPIWVDFENSPGWDYPLNVDFTTEDGKLVIDYYEVVDDRRFPGRYNSFLDAYNFALSYEFQVSKGFPEFGVYFRSSYKNTLTVDDDDYYRLMFDRDKWYINRFDSTANRWISILADGTYKNRENQKVLLIAFEDTVEIYLNDQLVAQLNDVTTKDLENYFFVKYINETDSIEFDNIQFWNLDGVDLESTQAQPQWHELVQAYTGNTAPTFADDFSTKKQAWGVMSDGYELRINDGEINLELSPNVSFPINGLLNADNFVMQFSYNLRSAGLSFKFRGRLWVKSQGYRIDLNEGKLTLLEMEGEEILHTSGYSNEGSPTLLLYVINNNIAIFIDGQMVYNDKTLTHTNVSQVNQFINSMDEGVFAGGIDNVFFWNLDGVDLTP